MFKHKNPEIHQEETDDLRTEKDLKELKDKIEKSWNEDFNSLTEKHYLSDNEIEQIIEYSNNNNLEELKLNNLRNITDKQAKYLSKFKWTVLWLDWLTEASDKQIKKLSKFEWHELRLDWLKNLNDKQASYLSESCRRLFIGWVKTITDTQLNKLIINKWYEHLELSWIEKIIDPQIDILLNFEWNRICLCENSLTEEQKTILRNKLWEKLILTWKSLDPLNTN